MRRLSGWLAVRDGRVWLERGCPAHGFVSTLYDESAEILRYLEQWTAPTKVHTPDLLGNVQPIPAALTHTGVLSRLEAQIGGLVTWRDLTALPCSHPHCCSVGYLLRDDSGAWRSLTALVGHDQLKRWIELEPEIVANRIADRSIPAAVAAAVKDSLLGLLSEQSSLSHPSIAQLWRTISADCDLGIGTLSRLAASTLPGQRQRLRALLGERVLRLTVSRSWTSTR